MLYDEMVKLVLDLDQRVKTLERENKRNKKDHRNVSTLQHTLEQLKTNEIAARKWR